MHYCLAVSVKVCLGFLTGSHEQGSCKGTVNVGAVALTHDWITPLLTVTVCGRRL